MILALILQSPSVPKRYKIKPKEANGDYSYLICILSFLPFEILTIFNHLNNGHIRNIFSFSEFPQNSECCFGSTCDGASCERDGSSDSVTLAKDRNERNMVQKVSYYCTTDTI